MAAGVSVRFDLVPNMAHDGLAAVPQVQTFLAEVLGQCRAG